MGLDLIVEARAKPGHVGEWRNFVERSFANEELTEEEMERFAEISISDSETVGAPRIGFDESANAWVIKREKAETPEQVAAVLKESHGLYVLALVKCDGIPRYSNAAADYGIDETSFRGAWLRDCTDVLESLLLTTAWNNMWPPEAVAYGDALLLAADRAEGKTGPIAIRALHRLLTKIGLNKAKSESGKTLAEQLDIVRAAGRWYVYWGERGHPIRAWF